MLSLVARLTEVGAVVALVGGGEASQRAAAHVLDEMNELVVGDALVTVVVVALDGLVVLRVRHHRTRVVDGEIIHGRTELINTDRALSLEVVTVEDVATHVVGSASHLDGFFAEVAVGIHSDY